MVLGSCIFLLFSHFNKIVTMKTKLVAFALLFLSVANFSCTKDNEPNTYQVAGLWIGTYTVTQLPQQTPLFYSFAIKPDGKILVEGVGANGKTYYSAGTWALNGTTFTTTYLSINYDGGGGQVTQSATTTYNSAGTMTGTWTDTANPNGGSLSGTLTLSRVN
jgi:hypothetical protein